MIELNELARKKGLFIDNAATASQNKSLVDDPVTREAIELNIIAPLILAISERDTEIDRLKASLPPVDAGDLVERLQAKKIYQGIDRNGRAYAESGPDELCQEAAAAIITLQGERDTVANAWLNDRRDWGAKIEAAEAEVARLKAELAEAHRAVERIQASDDWHYRDIPVVEWANRAEGYESALEVIAGSHWERVGYCQSDVEDVPDLTAVEAQSHARATLQRFRRARSFRDGQKTGEKG